MRDLKNKEIIFGMIIILVLSIIALILIFKKNIVPTENTSKSEHSIDKDKLTDDTSKPSVTGDEVVQDSDKTAITPEAEPTSTTVPIRTKEDMINYPTFIQSFPPYREYEEGFKHNELYGSGYKIPYEDEGDQLAQLYDYWDQYKLDAVHDLINLERIRSISSMLGDSSDYYYYGSTDSSGNAHGKGLAMYAHNTYYFGEWKNGFRSGNGMWLQEYVLTPGSSAIPIIVEHSYSGQWKNGFPNGKGQENYEYNYQNLKFKGFSITNVIGNFVDGYYDGNVYMMTYHDNGNIDEWNGTAKYGVWTAISDPNDKGQIPILQLTDKSQNYIWMLPEENYNQGIWGLKRDYRIISN